MKVYLAGKVRGPKWNLFTADQIKRLPIVSSDGGCHSEHSFGWGVYDWNYCQEQYKESIQKAFVERLDGCKILVAYLDTPDSFGSIAEIAYASSKGIPSLVLVVTKDWFFNCPRHGESQTRDGMFDAYWFVCSLPLVSVKPFASFDDVREEIQERVVSNILGYEKKTYSDYLSTERWQGLRKKALKNANYRCQLCNKQGRLHVHHRSYENKGNHNEWKDLICLCEECHATYHNRTTAG